MTPIMPTTLKSTALSLLALLAGAVWAQTAPPAVRNVAAGNNPKIETPAALNTDSKDDYVIGADDVLAINVWKEPELSRSAPVRPDGKVTLPLVGDIEASGNTPKQLQASIEKVLEKYISRPVVTVIVQEIKSHKFSIVGEVQKPGTYPLTGPLTVLEGIAQAGGFREWAKIKDIIILRTGSTGTREKLHFNYKSVIKGDSSRQNVQLQTGDTIVVP
jgi:polysaccharide export outer membrane protein